MASFINPRDCLAHRTKEFEQFILTHKFQWDNNLRVGRAILYDRNAIQHGTLPSLPEPSNTPADTSTFQQGEFKSHPISSNPEPEPEPEAQISPRLAFLRQLATTPSLSPQSSSSSISTSEPPLFTTEFFEILKCGMKGYGAFATKDIEAGTLIMSEKPLFKAQLVEVHAMYEGLTDEERKEYRKLCSWTKLDPHPTMARFFTNRFEINASTGGIFLQCSRFNHTCPPYKTCSYMYNGSKDCLEVTAHRSIKHGEELTISYSSNPRNLYHNYGFHCDCPDCKGSGSGNKGRYMITNKNNDDDNDEPWIKPGGKSFGKNGVVLNELTHHYYSTFGRSAY